MEDLNDFSNYDSLKSMLETQNTINTIVQGGGAINVDGREVTLNKPAIQGGGAYIQSVLSKTQSTSLVGGYNPALEQVYHQKYLKYRTKYYNLLNKNK